MKQISIKRLSLLIVGICFGVAAPTSVHAIPPPEFIIQITSQIVPIFGWIFAVLIAGLGIAYNFLRSMIRNTYVLIGVGVFVAFGLAIGSAYYIDGQYQKDQVAELQTQIESQQQAYVNKQAEGKEVPNEVIEPVAAEEDLGAQFIRTYYTHLSEGSIEAAYAMTTKRIPFDRFTSWYADTTSIDIEKVEHMDSQNYSVRVKLWEGEESTTFGVLATVKYNELSQPVELVSTEVVTLGVLGTGVVDHNEKDFVISNIELQKKLGSNEPYLVLDARERIEHEYGRFPGSTHIKFADLQSEEGWKVLPTDKPVYVFCWSGIRGDMVATYLRGKGINAYYVEDGAKGWVDFGGTWNGEIQFGSVYEAPRYSKVFLTDQFNKEVANGAILIDSRQPEKFSAQHITGSFPMRLMYTATKDIDAAFSDVPPNSKVITLCDDYVNCFDARLIGIEAEYRGHEFLGRYVYIGE